MKKVRVSIYDPGDRCTYDLDLTQDDMLALWNMKNLKKHLIDLPSIGGNANLSGNQVHIMYRSGGGMESIGVNFFTLKKILEEALPSFN